MYVFCLPTCVIIPYKSKFTIIFRIFCNFSFNANFIYMIGNPFNFEKNVKTCYFPKVVPAKKHFNEMWKKMV